MSNAHNYVLGSLPIYRFLCDLQSQGICSQLGFSWGLLDQNAVFLPRVVYKNFILHPAQWMLSIMDFNPILNYDDREQMLLNVQSIIEKFCLPDEIVLVSGDNELRINLKIPHNLKLLKDEIKGMDKIIIHEYLNYKDGLIAGDQGCHANECLFFIYKKHSANNDQS